MVLCVVRFMAQEPVRLEVTGSAEAWTLKDLSTGLVLPADQNVGSLVAGFVAYMNEGQAETVTLSVGSEAQSLTVERYGPLPSDFTIEDEEGMVYDALESPMNVVLSTTQMEVIAEFFDRPVRKRPESV